MNVKEAEDEIIRLDDMLQKIRQVCGICETMNLTVATGIAVVVMIMITH